jgi:hypothetical protein
MMFQTQRVTEVDLRAGRIRIPIGQKDPFPPRRERLAIDLRGEHLDDVAWDPRLGPDRERSGVLYIGAAARRLITAGDRLTIEIGGDGITLR